MRPPPPFSAFLIAPEYCHITFNVIAILDITSKCDTNHRMNTIEKVRTLVSQGLMTRAGLARAAGLHANTLRDCGDDSWNPTTETLA